MFSSKKKYPDKPTREIIDSIVTYADKQLASIIVALRRGSPTDAEWDRVQGQVASWRQSVKVSPFKEETMSADAYWYRLIMKYYLDGDQSKEFNAESYLQWIWESHKWNLYQTIYYASGKRDESNSPYSMGDYVPHPSTLDFSQFISWEIPNLRFDKESFLLLPVPTEPDIIRESESFETDVIVIFRMGGIIELARFPKDIEKTDKQNFLSLLDEYNQNIRGGYHRIMHMSPRVGVNEGMKIEFQKWESERQVLIQKLNVLGWLSSKTPQYIEYDARFQSEWNSETGEWNLGEVRLYFKKAKTN